MKSATKVETGAVVDLAGAAVLGDAPLVQDDDAVGYGQRLVLIVRDVDGGEAEPLLELADLGAHATPEPRVEIRKGLVKEENLRLQDERARNGDPLLLPA